MSIGENDSETLQLLDELNSDWVKRWQDTIEPLKDSIGEFDFVFFPPEKEEIAERK